MEKKPSILISNDDGVFARGIRVLEQGLREVGETTIVAPLEEKSTTGHHLTIHKPIRVKKIEPGIYGTSGGPADSVQLGIGEVMKDAKPDLVVSGVNRGFNLGQDVFYSGTVSAAREAAINGIPGIAVSVRVVGPKLVKEEDVHFETGARAVVEILKTWDFKSLPKGTVLNVNAPSVPWDEVKGIRTTRLGFLNYSHEVESRVDHRGQPYYWIGGAFRGFEKLEGSDALAVDQNYISVTPIQLDCTNESYGKILEKEFEAF